MSREGATSESGKGLIAGDVVRILPGCPWPERVGLLATVEIPPRDGTFPQPAQGELLLHIDDDPLTASRDRYWTCVMSASDVEPV